MKTRRCAQIESLEPRRLMSTTASGWTITDDYQSPGAFTVANALAVDRSSNPATAGTVYAVGYGKDAAGHYEGFVREKLPGSSTWRTVQDYVYTAGRDTQFNSATVAPNGTLYVSGQAKDSSGLAHWIVLSSTGGPLKLVDNFVPTSGHNSYSTGIASDASGNVFAAGYGGYSPNGGRNTSTFWFTRELKAGSNTFTTVDAYQKASNIDCEAQCLAIAGSGASETVYVVGGTYSGLMRWIVRKGANAGSSWSTADDFSYDGIHGSTAYAVAVDNSGNVFVGGHCSAYNSGSTSTSIHWVVREAPAGGTSWATVDDWQFAPGQTADIWGIGLDALGNVNVVGTALQNSTTDWAIIRNNAGPNGSWQMAEQYQYSPNPLVGSQFRAFTYVTDPTTGVTSDYAAGLGNLGNGNIHWIVLDPPVSADPASSTDGSLHVLSRHIRRQP